MVTRRMYWGLVILITLVVTATVWVVVHNNAAIEQMKEESAELLPQSDDPSLQNTPKRVADSPDYQPPPLGETDDTGYWEGNTWHQKPAPKPKKRGFWSEDIDTLAHRIIRGVEIKNPERFQLAQRIIREYPYSEAVLKMRYTFMHYDENGYSRSLGGEDQIEYLKGMLKYHPNSPRVLSDLAMYLSYDSSEEAIAFAKKSLRVDPSNIDAHDALGTAYQRLGDYKTALVHLKAGQKLSDPNDGSRWVEIVIDENTSLYNDYDEFTYEISMIAAGTPRYGPAPQPPVSSSVDVPMFPSDAVSTPPPALDPSFDPLSTPFDMPAASSVDERDVASAGSPSWRDAPAGRARASMETERRRREEFDSFLQWMEQIERAKSPADLDDFLMREMAMQLQGGTSAFTPDRLVRAFETLQRHGERQGRIELEKRDAELAREMERASPKNGVSSRSVPNKS